MPLSMPSGGNGYSIGAWNDVVYLNAWTNFGGAGNANLQYRLDANNLVRLRGVAKIGTAGAPTAPIAVCNLPAGFRPPFNVFFNSISNDTSWGEFKITPAGDLEMHSGPTVANSWFVFDNFVFSIS